MTITLAAVYAPIGFQGGLTGALFREFAFTLAGAVFISGVVALTLSPMMSSRLLRAEHEQRLARAQGRPARSTRVRTRYARLLAATLRCRPAVYAVWIVLVAAGRPDVHVLAERAGARTRTRASCSARSTCPPTRRSSRSRPTPTQVDRNLRRRRPSSSTASRSRFPTGGFGGMLAQAVDASASAASSRSSSELNVQAGGHHRHPRAGVPAAGAARARASSRSSSCIASTAEHEELVRFADQLVDGGDDERPVRVPADHRRAHRPGARPRSSSIATRSASMGLTHAAGRRRPRRRC